MLGTAIAPKLKKRLTLGSTRKVLVAVAPGSSGPPPTEPAVPLGCWEAKKGNQSDPLPPSAIEMIGAVAASPMLNVSNVPSWKPRRVGANEIPLAGTRLVTVTRSSTCPATAEPAAVRTTASETNFERVMMPPLR